MKQQSAVILRKVSGVLTACFTNRTSVSVMRSSPSIASTALALTVLLLPVIAIMALVALLAPKMIVAVAAAKFAGLAFLGETETVTNHAAELRGKYKERLKEVGELLELAGPDRDLSKKSVLERLGAKDAT